MAIAHDYLTQRGGAERVVLALLRAFPEATVHTLLYDPDGTFPEFRDARVVTSPLNRIGPLRRHHRLALPLLAPAASRMTIDADVTIVSTSGWAHGFDIRGRSVVYCHNPARWLYQTDEYLGDAVPRSPDGAGPARARRRRCAAGTARGRARHDRYLANSHGGPRAHPRRRTASTPTILFPPTVRRRPPAPRSRSGPSTPGFHLRRLAAAALQERRPGRRGVPRPPGRTTARHRPRPRGGAAARARCPPTWRSSPTSATPSCAGPTRTAPRWSRPRSRTSG